MGIKDSFHFSALWWEAEWLASKGLIAIVVVNSKAFVAPHGGSSRVFGTNPMAFAFPREDGLPPIVWDQASSLMARGDMQLACEEGRTLPPNAAIDTEGKETSDPAAGLAGAQLPFGGPKGGNIALMVELMAAALTGGQLSLEALRGEPSERDKYPGEPPGGPTSNGELLIAIDPCQFETTTGSASAPMAASIVLQESIESQPGARLPSTK